MIETRRQKQNPADRVHSRRIRIIDQMEAGLVAPPPSTLMLRILNPLRIKRGRRDVVCLPPPVISAQKRAAFNF